MMTAVTGSPAKHGLRGRMIGIAIGVALGLAGGIGGFTFVYARGASYLTNDPAACANCHIMNDQYDAWLKSSHRAVAVCNDCHTPHGLGPKYVTKGLNGFWHSYAFTLGGYPDPLRITGQTYTRKLDVLVLRALAGIAVSAHKFTNDLRLLQGLAIQAHGALLEHALALAAAGDQSTIYQHIQHCLPGL